MQFVMELAQAAGVPSSAANYSSLSSEQRQAVVKAFLGRLDLIDGFVAANPARLSAEELGIVSSWCHLVSGRFIALRQLKKHMVFLACDGKSGVTGLFEPVERVIGQPLPAMVQTVLLPFRGKIVYDGVISKICVAFGPGSRRGFEETFRTIKQNHRLLTSLPQEARASQPGTAARKPRSAETAQKRMATVQEVLQQVVAMTDAFCQRRLNEEYLALCRKRAEKLAAKRPSPLLRGDPRTWACGIIRTIGWVNFLDDLSQSPRMKLPVIDQALGVAESTGQGKAKAIRRGCQIRLSRVCGFVLLWGNENFIRYSALGHVAPGELFRNDAARG